MSDKGYPSGLDMDVIYNLKQLSQNEQLERLWQKLDDIHSVLIEMRDKHD